MICLCEVLDCFKYQLNCSVAILESKTDALIGFGLRNEKMLHLYEIDSRLLTRFYHSLLPEYDWFIVVYDYVDFCTDHEIKEAIIWHELGHIKHPVSCHTHELEAEIKCDELANKNGYGGAMTQVLDLTLAMATSLNHRLLQEMTKMRKIHLSG